MGWAAFSISSPEMGEVIALQLLKRANDPVTWTLANMGATVIRRRMEDGDHFYFSPHAMPVFAELIESHRATPCDPPRTRELVPSKTSRIMLGFKTHWEPFVPVRAVSKGIPRPSQARHSAP